MSNLIKHKQTIHSIECLNKETEAAMELVLLESDLTVRKCMDTTLVINIEKAIHKKQIISAVRFAIINCSKVFKFSEKMDIETATFMAADLVDVFKYESFEDIILMLKMARQGKLGSNKGRFDNDTLFNIFVPTYLDMKAEEREKEKQNEKAELKRREEQPYKISPENKKKLDELIERLDKKKEKTEVPSSVLSNHQIFISRLPELCKNLSDKELKEQIQKAQSYKLSDAYEIYKTELEKRNEHKKTLSEKRKVGNPIKSRKQSD
ncbi:hypothetical protein ETU09_00580 [Apibacter muscae]|uniref:Uncharacterized protein n=1 Tax=Apibacter muscae TaxID=2509004 RepID=A0A563DK96_9FLAO|nr:hypothetical protein [Apibacter muscae]TWP30529.1 hypothetical protein ETU09_00580 [Apibacter muscae]